MGEQIIGSYGFIYITTNLINGKKYIGQRMYCRDWRYYLGSGKYFKLSIKKYGRENFKREIIEIAYSKEELNKLEKKHIKKHNAVESKKYYNILEGGNGSPTAGTHYSDELKKKLSLANIGYKASDETRKKISFALQNGRNPHIGEHWTEERKLKSSLARMGHKASEETKKKMSDSSKGSIVSIATRIKIGNLHRNKIVSSETKQKLSEFNKAFSYEQAEQIRIKYATKKYPQYMLAKEYLTSQSVISNIINYKSGYNKVNTYAM